MTIGGRPGTNDPIAVFVRPITCTSVAGDKPHLRPANQGMGFDMWNASAPVVVGVDGSDAAIDAAIWASDEAVSRDVPLRIVHVTHIEDQRAATDDDLRLDVQYAEASVRAATAAVEATGTQVKIETEVLWGTVKTVLIDESRNAAMICLGSVGIGAIAGKVLGSTAATLAKESRCPVASIRESRRQRVGHRARNGRGPTAKGTGPSRRSMARRAPRRHTEPAGRRLEAALPRCARLPGRVPRRDRPIPWRKQGRIGAVGNRRQCRRSP